MIQAFATLLGFQLTGEVISRLAAPVAPGPVAPGPVTGFAFLILAFALRPRLAEALRPVATGMPAPLSLFFAPAGVGVMTQPPRLGADAAAIMVALIVSTLLAIVVGGLVFAGVARLTGAPEEVGDD